MRMGFCLAALMLAAGTHARLADAETKVRRVEVKKDQIVQVRTAPMIATIIQVPDRPNSVVLGNQNAFQVEYLDTAVTVKSLIPHGRGNLYIYTDYRRYNVELVTGNESAADYIVYLEEPKRTPSTSQANSPSPMRWKTFVKSETLDGLRLTTSRIGERSDGYYLIEFTLEAKPGLRIDPGWFWTTQSGKSRPIQNLFLSKLDVPENGKVGGTLVLNRNEIEGKSAIRIEVRRKRVLSLETPKVALWK